MLYTVRTPVGDRFINLKQLNMQLYKVLTPFEFDNKARKIGEEIVCSAREAEKLMEEKKITPADKELDPENPAHKPLLKEARDRKDAKHAETTAAVDAKDAAKDEREAGKDDALKAKRDEAVKMATDLGRDDIAAIEAMGEAEMDKEIATMKGATEANATEAAKKEAKKDEKPAETKDSKTK